MRCALILIVLMVLCPPGFSQNQYLCVAEKANGFIFDESVKEWVHAKFKADTKYLISKPVTESEKLGCLGKTDPTTAITYYLEKTHDDRMKVLDRTPCLIVRRLGETDVFAGCNFDDANAIKALKSVLDTDQITCNGATDNKLIVNRKTGLFVYTYPNLGPKDTPFVEIGKCSPF